MRISVITSLLDMLHLDPEKFLPPISYMAAAISEWKVLQQLEGHMVPQALSFEVRVGFLKSAEILKETAQALTMTTTTAVIEDSFDDIVAQLSLNRPLSAYELQKITSFGEKVLSVFMAEARSRQFVTLAAGHAAFLSPSTPLFGDAVDDAFPAASLEISDAGRCRAAGLWTASIMHLMRGLEDALNSLASYVGIDIGQNWNTALNQIDAKLKERGKSLFGPDEEQWAAETSAHLRAIKNAWRNHAQHAHARYNEEEAVSIWNNVQSLLQTLARRLNE